MKISVLLFVCFMVGLVIHAHCFLFGGDTCVNRCHSSFHAGDDYSCQCNHQCVTHGDCCGDYQAVCLGLSDSCQGRCHLHSTSHSCQCNSHCVRYNDCCSDYNTVCVAGSTPTSGPCQSSTSEMGQVLWDNDVNRLSSSDVTTNYQTQVSDGSTLDKSSSRFFTKVEETKLTSPTFSAFINLLNNYDPENTHTEHSTSHETAEVNTFLDAVLETKVMDELQKFLICQNKISSKSDLKTTLKKIWFEFYTRGSRDAYHSSSGFEHVLVGEFKDSTIVNGFHSWLSFYEKEKTGDINYLGYVSKRTDPELVGATFTWNGHYKAKGTFFVGTSPEFDLAIYTLCYLMYSANGNICQLNINGHGISIKTFDSNGHIATAYVL